MNAYTNQMTRLGLGGIKADAPEPYCQMCQDNGTYEVFYFAEREDPIITLQQVYKIMGLGWQKYQHYSEAHRCRYCFPKFEKRHNELVESIKNAPNKVDELMTKAELMKLWGRGVR